MANDEVRKFSTDDIQEVATENSVEFAIAKIAVLSTRPNSHKMKITEEVLRDNAHTMLGKWVVTDYSKWQGDFTSHTVNQKVIGIIPKDQEVEFVRTEDGYLVAYVQAVLSKIYATDEYKLFVKDNFRNVSIEMGVVEHDIEDPYFKTEVDKFVCYGVTVLGKKVNPSCSDAQIQIVQFSDKDATDYYTKERALKLSDELRRFAESLDSKDKIDERTNPMEDNVLQTEQFAEDDKDKKDVVMSEDAPKEEPKSEESKEMAEPKEEPKTEDEKDMSEPTQMAEEPKEKEEDKEEKTEEKDMSCGGDTEKMGCGEDKKFSLEQFASEDSLKELSDEMAELVKMESADEVIKKFAEKSDEIKKLSERVAELEEYQTKQFEAEKQSRVDSILAEVKEDLAVEKFEELVEEGKTIALSDVDAFANKVKAFAYEASKNKVEEPKNEEGITLMASNDSIVEKDNDVFSRLSKKYK